MIKTKIKKDQQHAMQIADLEMAVINTFIHYDTNHLKSLDPDAVYSFNYHYEFIADLQKKVENLKKDYPKGLYAKESVCMFCYPGFKAFSFYSKSSDEYVMRYVIAEDKDMYRVGPCNNNPIPDGPDGMPF